MYSYRWIEKMRLEQPDIHTMEMKMSIFFVKKKDHIPEYTDIPLHQIPHHRGWYTIP